MYIAQIVADEFANPRPTIDVRDDLQKKSRFLQRRHDGFGRQQSVLVSHRPGGNPGGTEIQRSDERVAFHLEGRRRELLRKAPQFASARDRRIIVQEHGMDIETSLTLQPRSEEHTSELQSHVNLVCRLLLEKKKI